MSIRVLHVSNISPFATKEQIQTLFAYVGRIEEFKLFPTDYTLAQSSQQPKFAYVKFEDDRGVEVGQHLTNTVFLDRALVCVQGYSNTIPDEESAIQGGGVGLPGQRQLPPHISNQVQDVGDGQKMIVTIDPNLAALGLPAYPPLPPTTEPTKLEEIRRTVYVGNLPKGCDGEELLNFFNACIGEVMYLRMAAGNEYLPCDYAYVEFSQQASVPLALQNSDSLEFQGRVLRIQHSKVAIIKPQRKTVEQSLEEVEEAIRGGAIGGAMELGRGYSPSKVGVVGIGTVPPPLPRRESPAVPTKKRSQSSKSRSRTPRKSRDRSTRRRSKSRSRSSSYSRSRRRSRSTRRRSRSRTPDRSSRKRSRSRKRSAERSKKNKRSSRSRERSTKKDKESGSSGGKASKKAAKEKEREREKDKERSSRKEEKKEKEASSSAASSSKKERKRSRSRSAKKEKREEEEKSSKKSKRSSDDSHKKAKSSKESPADSGASSKQNDTPTKMEISTPEKPQKKEPLEVEEEESLRERLLERVKLKQQHKEEDE